MANDRMAICKFDTCFFELYTNTLDRCLRFPPDTFFLSAIVFTGFWFMFTGQVLSLSKKVIFSFE